jgi:hypothetical protein
MQMASAMDSNATSAGNHLGESWAGMRDNALDALGTQYWYYAAECNYDCVTYPWTM